MRFRLFKETISCYSLKSDNPTGLLHWHVSSTPQRDQHRTRRPKARAESQRIGKKYLPDLLHRRKSLKSCQTAINAFIGPIRPPHCGTIFLKGPFVIFITQQSNSNLIRITTWGQERAFTHTYARKPGDSYILTVNEDYECRLEGVPTIRYFSPRKDVAEAVDADRAIEAYKDIYQNT